MLSEKFKLNDKVAVVTGSGKGIGKCIALTFAETGANVVFAARTEKDIQAAAEEAKKLGVRAIAVPCDVTREEDLQNLADKTVEAFGQIDIVVNVAGGAGSNTISETTRKQLNDAFDFNVAQAFSLIRFCLPHLQKAKGCVINISTAAARIVQPNFSLYGSVKAALNQITRLMAADLAPDVRVNAIAPGAIMTDGLRSFLDSVSLQKMSNLIPMKTLGEVEDIAMAALYLASPAARWVTGKVLEIDGGTEASFMPF